MTIGSVAEDRRAGETARASAFAVTAAAILAFFLILEIVYAFRLPRVMDEFTGARYVYMVTRALPYRDFQPPKTVVAYYIESPPLWFIRGHWYGMVAIKIELALLWTAVLACAAAVLRRVTSDRAVLAALAMVAVMSTFVERATEVRPDAIAAMFGIASLVALISIRPALAGVLCALSFCSTQKGIYFAVAGGVALIAIAARDRDRQSILAVIRYAIASFAVVIVYFLFWTARSSADAVIGRVLLDKNIRAIALTDMYAGMRAHYWSQTIVRNPFFYAAALIGLALLAVSWNRNRRAVAVVLPYAVVLSALCIWHKQPWPYFFVFLIPTLFVVIAVALAGVQWTRTVAFAVVAGTVLIPLTRLPITLSQQSTAYQKAMIDAAEQLLQPNETYIDGTNMLYRHEQAAPEYFRWIDATTLREFAQYTPAEQMQMIIAAERDRPKLVILSYRITGLPALVRAYIRNRFSFVYGDVMLASQEIRAPRFSVAFDGDYALSAPAVIDGAPARGTVALRRGTHTVSAVQSTRLKLLPPRGLRVDPQFAAPQNLFDRVYDY